MAGEAWCGRRGVVGRHMKAGKTLRDADKEQGEAGGGAGVGRVVGAAKNSGCDPRAKGTKSKEKLEQEKCNKSTKGGNKSERKGQKRTQSVAKKSKRKKGKRKV